MSTQPLTPPNASSDVDPAEDRRLYDLVCETKRKAEASGLLEDYQSAGAAYRAYMRFHLSDPERECLRLEDEIVRLTTENRLLKMRLRFNA